jgi:hypothetical protein
VWCNEWLSRGRRLTLVKSVLKAISVYWMYLAFIPEGMLEKMRRISFTFLWFGHKVNSFG